MVNNRKEAMHKVTQPLNISLQKRNTVFLQSKLDHSLKVMYADQNLNHLEATIERMVEQDEQIGEKCDICVGILYGV